MKLYFRGLFVLIPVLSLWVVENCHATKKWGVYSETIPGCIICDSTSPSYPPDPPIPPNANSRIGTYQDKYGTTIDLYNDSTDYQEGEESIKAEINVVPGGWLGWFVQWGVYWEKFPNETTVVNMSIYATGDLKFYAKTPISLKIGIRSNNASPGSEHSVNLSDYCPIDNDWHEVSIPISDFTSGKALRLDKTKILFNVAREGETEGTEYFWIDNVRWTTVPEPTAPTGLNATLGDKVIILKWKDNSDNELGFEIWRRKYDDDWKQIDTVSANATLYEDRDPEIIWTHRIKYFYRVRAYNDAGYSDYDETEIITCIVVWPNPFIPSRGHTEITFKGSGVIYATVRIYNIAGDLIRILEETQGIDIITWDVTNDNGAPLVGGVYIWTSESPMEKNKGKLAIIK